MKITRAHLAFWREHRVPVPAWAKSLPADSTPIDALIPQPARSRLTVDPCEPGNTITLLKSMRRRVGEAEMIAYVTNPHHTPTTLRESWCRRWTRRLRKEKN